jgi:hypothetical protein
MRFVVITTVCCCENRQHLACKASKQRCRPHTKLSPPTITLHCFSACSCRLLVNLVTSVTLGLALAAEPAEPTVMERPPRRPNKRLLGKLILWRCFFVCHLVVVLVLGMFEWALTTGRSLGQARAEAFNVLVGAQVVYFITCRCAEECAVLLGDSDGSCCSVTDLAWQQLYLKRSIRCVFACRAWLQELHST